MPAQILHSAELVANMREVQAQQIQDMFPHVPRLDIVTTQGGLPSIESYFRAKSRHAKAVGAEFHEHPESDEDEALHRIRQLNIFPTDAVVMQLPAADPRRTDELCDAIVPEKDIDGLTESGREIFVPPTPLATIRLAEFYCGPIEDIGADRVAVLGLGRLVGSPLVTLLKSKGIDPLIITDKNPDDIELLAARSDLVISATGVAKLIKPHHLRSGMTVVDAGVASEGGIMYGDVDPAVYEIDGIRVSPVKGGVGPLTVACLYENLIHSATRALSDTAELSQPA